MFKNYSIIFLLFLLYTAEVVMACDPCVLYNLSRLQGHNAGTFNLSISEQFTSYNKAQDLKDNSIKDGELVNGFSTTQFSLSYDITENLGFQVTLPFIIRNYDQIQNYRSSDESDAGIGDISLVSTYSFLNYKNQDWTLIAGLTGGVKLPTGDTGALEDVVNDDEEDEVALDKYFLKHHQIASSSAGNALVFGTGSYDIIYGLNLLSRYQKYLMLSSAQYTQTTEGDFNYQFANNFLFTVGGGYYFLTQHDVSMAGLVSLSGEFKAKDHLNNQVVTGSQYSNLYLGPSLIATFNNYIGAELGTDFRVTGEDDGTTVVPEMRIKANLSYSFS